MASRFVDGEKVLESVVYITNHGVNDVWKALKLLFYAEKFHMEKFGQSMTGDVFIAMEQGPVPSFAYDVIKRARGNCDWQDPLLDNLDTTKAFTTYKNFRIASKRKANLDVLCESAIECLNKSLETYGPMTDAELSVIAHKESCYISTTRNCQISTQDYLDWLNLSPKMREYISS